MRRGAAAASSCNVRASNADASRCGARDEGGGCGERERDGEKERVRECGERESQ